MDVELREALSTGFGPEPEHRPLVDRLEAGHRAVRRRRAAGSAVAVALAAVVGFGTIALLDSGGEAPVEVVADPASDWEGGEVAAYDAQGNLEIRPEVEVLERIDSPFPPSAGMDHSVALYLEYEGEESWLLMTWTGFPDGKVAEGGAQQVGATTGSFENWVAEQVRIKMTPTPEDSSAGYIRFADDGSLLSSHGVQILDEVLDPDLPESFAPPEARTAAALLREPDGKKFYVLLREVDGLGLDTNAVPFRMGGPDLEAFIAYARARYLSGGEVG